MLAPRILVVEDDSAVRQMLRFVLQQNRFNIVEAIDAEAAQELLKESRPNLILLDWMLPGLSGIDFAKKLKRDRLTKDIPIIIITAKGAEEDKVRGLESGADDYVTKPFSTRELIARIRAVIRRASPHAAQDLVELHDLSIDPMRHRVSANKISLEVGPTEFRLLHFFMTHQNKVYSRSQLLDSVWGVNSILEERTVDVSVGRLRGVLAETGHDVWLQTIRGVGYRFSDAELGIIC